MLCEVYFVAIWFCCLMWEIDLLFSRYENFKFDLCDSWTFQSSIEHLSCWLIGIGRLPGRSYAENETIWLRNAHLADTKLFSRSLLAKASVEVSKFCYNICFRYLDMPFGMLLGMFSDCLLLLVCTAYHYGWLLDSRYCYQSASLQVVILSSKPYMNHLVLNFGTNKIYDCTNPCFSFADSSVLSAFGRCGWAGNNWTCKHCGISSFCLLTS